MSKHILCWNFANVFCLLNRLSSKLVAFPSPSWDYKACWTIACVVSGDRRTDSNSVDDVTQRLNFSFIKKKLKLITIIPEPNILKRWNTNWMEKNPKENEKYNTTISLNSSWSQSFDHKAFSRYKSMTMRLLNCSHFRPCSYTEHRATVLH